MRSTFKLLFYINRNKVKSDGTTAVLCRISIDGKKSAVTTGRYSRCRSAMSSGTRYMEWVWH